MEQNEFNNINCKELTMFSTININPEIFEQIKEKSIKQRIRILFNKYFRKEKNGKGQKRC